MPQKQGKQQINYGDEIIGWSVPEYEKYERTETWYIAAAIIAVLLLSYSFWTANFLFAVIIIIVGMVIILHDGREPAMVRFSITDEGVIIGRKFYDFDEIKDFSVVYKPKRGVKNLYFEFKNAIKHRLSIPLQDMNPLPIRENLLKYLKEDLERTDQPASEGIARMLKL